MHYFWSKEYNIQHTCPPISAWVLGSLINCLNVTPIASIETIKESVVFVSFTWKFFESTILCTWTISSLPRSPSVKFVQLIDVMCRNITEVPLEAFVQHFVLRTQFVVLFSIVIHVLPRNAQHFCCKVLNSKKYERDYTAVIIFDDCRRYSFPWRVFIYMSVHLSLL